MKNRKISPKKLVGAITGIIFIGIGVAFISRSGFGNDPIGTFYDGMRASLGLSKLQLGRAANIVNFFLLMAVFSLGRKYLNLGTLIYILPYGQCVNLGNKLYTFFFDGATLGTRIVTSTVGCFCLFFGIALFIVMGIGLDPMTGIAMIINDKFHWDFKKGKWLLDGIMMGTGLILGGSFGVVTFVTTFAAAPAIQFFTRLLTKIWTKKRERSVAVKELRTAEN